MPFVDSGIYKIYFQYSRILTNMKHIQDFKYNGKQTVFKKANKLPPFFQNNLVDAGRVVKVFKKDPQANIRAFYFQFLKLCFEVQNQNYDEHIYKIEEILNNDSFKFIFYEDEDPELFNDLQFKQLIMEFFGVIVEENNDVEAALNKYPFMDTVFVFFFRSILILTGKADSHDSFIERMDLIEFLSGYFNVQLSIHNRCIKFVQTDVFLYEQNPNEVYMAFILNLDQYAEQQQSNSRQLSDGLSQSDKLMDGKVNQSNIDVSNHKHLQYQPKSSKGSYISGQFIDYTSTLSTKQPNHITVSERPIINQSQSQSEINISKKTIQQKDNQFKYQHNQFVPASIKTKNEIKGVLNQQHNMISNVANKIQRNHQEVYNSNKNIQPGGSANGMVNYGHIPSTYAHPQKYNVGMQPANPSFLKHNVNNYQGNDYKAVPSSQYSTKISSQMPSSLAQSKRPSYEVSKPNYELNKVQSFKTLSTLNSPSNYKKESVFGLNVSEQFTNSLTMKAMCEPYKSNVINIRQKARMFRNSLKFAIS